MRQSKVRISITDEDGVVLARHDVNIERISKVVTEIGLKNGELRGARAVLEAAEEVGSLVTDEIIAAIARYRRAGALYAKKRCNLCDGFPGGQCPACTAC